MFEVWTDPRHSKLVWPKDYPAVQMKTDIRPGGVWRACLKSTGSGPDLWVGGVYREIAAPERLVFTFAWEEEGERGLETVVTLTFTTENGKTRMTLRQAPFQSTEQRDGHSYGWNSSFDRLEEFYRKCREVSHDRDRHQADRDTRIDDYAVYDAPRALVFKMWIEPKHMAQWWGPKGFTNPRCELDARVGGKIHIDMRAPDGTVYPMSGTFREVKSPNAWYSSQSRRG